MSVSDRIDAWLRCEQTLNEPIDRDRDGKVRINLSCHNVRAPFRPDRQGRWPQQVVWLPRAEVRIHGPVDSVMRRAFGAKRPPGRAPLFIHPQAPAAHRRLAEQWGRADFGSATATPTSSHRSLLVHSSSRREAVILKLSLGARAGGARRSLSEREVVAGIVMSRLLDTIPSEARRRCGFDWFPETAGGVETRSGCGWLLRRLPRMIFEPEAGQLMPAFSLVSRRAQQEPLLAELIRRSRRRAEDVVTDQVLRPYVRVLSYLLFGHGIHVEGHAQNVLFEVGRRGALTGRLVLRDLSDMSFSLSHRLARQQPFPNLRRGIAPEPPPFPIASVTADHNCNNRRPYLMRGFDTVERFGLRAFVWVINTSMARFFPRYDAAAVDRAYLTLWQDAAIEHLGLRPLFRPRPLGLAVDEALAAFLEQTDWTPLGLESGTALPSDAEPIGIHERPRRKPGLAYGRIVCPWGSLYIDGTLPAFFRPAF